jgi:hypothetical protein
VRRSGAKGALVLGLLSLPFGILSPFAIWAASRSLRRGASTAGWIALAAGLTGAVFAVGGVVFWLLVS